MSDNKPLGLIAGQGDLPRLIIKKCAMQNRPIFVAAIEGQTPPETVKDIDHIWLKIGKIGSFIEAFNKHKIKEVVFAGGIKRPNFSNISLDWEGVKLAAAISYKTLGDDAILTAITDLLESKGFRILAPADILHDIRPKAGVLTLKSPTEEEIADINKGIRILDLLSSGDVGQAIIIQMGQVLGIEAIEGTEQLIRRVRDYKLATEGGLLVKTPKIQQNLKIDLPTIGIQTLHQLHASQLNGVAIEADRSQIIDQEAVIKLANELGLFIYVFNTN
ncbi:LpxI family protein [Candidatus Paracaedibacter symbiosus]|uniref:LpxI family protein n=1 Tax=Candidatus Paracaedibacter symbiosus TaxID=244582 RepID=UPI0018DB4F2A|nr:UDP-2,3-diacylglucosamine diphosphatase LpxI [Candidatus Paracaedibacter symbiosus]